jgi:hypothetical protein
MPAVRRLLRWALVTLGIAALVRWLRPRGGEPVPAPSEPTTDPAAELRRKLAESRADGEVASTPEASAESVEERRADVHAKGRSALSEMAPPDEG